MDHKVTTDYTRLLGNANVKVYVRARPCADGQLPPEDMFERKKDAQKNIVIKDTERMQYGNHAFSFDNIYWTDTSQSTLFESEACCTAMQTSKVLVDHALKGINSCCFAYGQTGSGKTFSIFGEQGEKAGLLSRSIEYLFDMIGRSDSKTKEVTLVVSFLEIYCDRVRDLARDYLKKTGRSISYQTSSGTEWFLRQHQIPRTESNMSMSSNPSALRNEEDYDYEKANFEIHEDAQGRVFVKDLSMVTVTSREEVDALVQSGLRLRATHETKMNAVSSRSHTVFTMHVFQQVHETNEVIYGMLNMVDLAGSERLKKSESDGQRLKEALHINSSLSAVGKVVMSLDPESGYQYIPYRDSKLTRLLQNSIGGNCYTILIATIHPMREHYEECLSTLQFANRCRSVQNQPRVNYINGSVVDKDRRIRKLQEEVSVLRRQLEGLKTEYNNRFVAALNELGFDAEEVNESGEIKFADGLVLRSAFTDDQGPDSSKGPVPSSGLPPARGGIFGGGSLSQSMKQANEAARNDREHLRQKYANAKSNFTVVVSEANKEKEGSRRIITEQKRRIAQLENILQQKAKEYDLSLSAEMARHREEIKELLCRNTTVNNTANGLVTNSVPQLLTNRSTSFTTLQSTTPGGTPTPKKTPASEQRLLQRVAALEASKDDQIAQIRLQYDQALRKKADELDNTRMVVQDMQAAFTSIMESIRGDCTELYAYVGRLSGTQANGRPSGTLTSTPKSILADPSKLRYIKAIMTTEAIRNYEQVQSLVALGGSASKSESFQPPRPVSAPVYRSRTTNYPSTLRDRVQHIGRPQLPGSGGVRQAF